MVTATGVEPQGQDRDTFRVTVVNRGAEAVTIKDIGLISADGGRLLSQVIQGWAEGGLSSGHDDAATPMRIESRGYSTWTFTDDKLQNFPHESKVFGYVDRYVTWRWWPWWPRRDRSIVRRTIGSRPVTRRGGADQPQYRTNESPR